MPSASRFSQRARWAAGQPISRLMQQALARPELISLAAGFVDQRNLPVAPVADAVGELLAEPDGARAALQYGTTPGDPELRALLLARLLVADRRTAEEGGLSIERMVITAGSNQLLHLLGDTLLEPGDIVLCGAPSYFVFLGAVQSLGARSVGVASDADGMIPAALEDELRRRAKAGELGRVKAIYVTSYYDNPAGATLPLARRRQIVELADRWSTAGRIWVIDDAAYRELRYYGDDEPSLLACDPAGEIVIHTGSFSKSFSPGIRVGWGVLPAALVEPVLNQKGNIDFGSPHFSQRLMATILRRGLFEAHVERLRPGYRAKLEAMLAAAVEHLGPIDGVSWRRPTGGLYVWLTLPPEVDAGSQGALFSHALNEGVLYVPGEHCYPAAGEPVRRNTLRLSFGVPSIERIRQGIEALGRAIRRTLDGAAA